MNRQPILLYLLKIFHTRKNFKFPANSSSRRRRRRLLDRVRGRASLLRLHRHLQGPPGLERDQSLRHLAQPLVQAAPELHLAHRPGANRSRVLALSRGTEVKKCLFFDFNYSFLASQARLSCCVSCFISAKIISGVVFPEK